MNERFGPNFAPGSFALQQSLRLVYTLRALSRGRNRSTRATRDNQDAHTQKEHTDRQTDTDTQTHTRQRRPNTTASSRLRKGAGRCCCCCATAVLLLLHDPQCIAEHNPSQQTVSCFLFFGTHAEASNSSRSSSSSSRSSNKGGRNICTSMLLDIRRGAVSYTHLTLPTKRIV